MKIVVQNHHIMQNTIWFLPFYIAEYVQQCISFAFKKQICNSSYVYQSLRQHLIPD